MKTIAKLTDNEVIEKYLKTQGDHYFNLLYDRYINKVYSKCISLLKDDALAEDAAQEIFLKIFFNISKFTFKSKFSTWVYSITYNYCIDIIRKRKKENILFSDELEHKDDIQEEVEDKELLEMEIQKLTIVLDKIPVGDKAVLIMKYKDELSIKEISEVLIKSESAIKMKLKRAKQKAKKVYQSIYAKSLIFPFLFLLEWWSVFG